jgi:hypothetical protein
MAALLRLDCAASGRNIADVVRDPDTHASNGRDPGIETHSFPGRK